MTCESPHERPLNILDTVTCTSSSSNCFVVLYILKIFFVPEHWLLVVCDTLLALADQTFTPNTRVLQICGLVSTCTLFKLVVVECVFQRTNTLVISFQRIGDNRPPASHLACAAAVASLHHLLPPLVIQHPDVVAEMRKRYTAWAATLPEQDTSWQSAGRGGRMPRGWGWATDPAAEQWRSTQKKKRK